MDSNSKILSEKEVTDLMNQVTISEVNNGTVSEKETVPLSDIEKVDRDTIHTIERILGVKYSDEQLKVLRHHGNACILACAGSGKTTILTNLVAKRLMTGEINHASRLLCTTYSKDGAVELEDRLSKLLNKVGIKQNVQVKTIHAFCYGIINRYFPGMYKVIDEGTSLKLLRQACAEAKFKPKDDDIMLLSSLMSFQVNNLLNDSSTVASPACKIEDLELSQYTNIRVLYNNKKREEKYLDFDDMQLIMWSWLVKEKNREVLGYCKSLFDHYLIDEAQDMSRIQYQIIKALVTEVDNSDKLEKTLVVVGDEDQCIYKWRGADPSIILDICPEFDIKKFVLSTNYRCQSEIVELASVGIKNNKNRVDKDMKAFKPGGKVKLLKTSHMDMYSMSKKALDYIKELIDSGVSADDIAVLSRNNFHLAILSNMCFREGIYSNVSADMKLTRNIMYKDIKAIIGLVDSPWNANNLKQVLWKTCKYLGISATNTIVDFQDKSALSFELAIGYLLKNFSQFSEQITLSKEVNVPAVTRERMRTFFTALSNETISDLYVIYNCLIVSDKVKGIETIFDMYLQSSCSFIYKNKDKERTVKGMVKYISELLDKYGLDKTLEFFRMSEQLEEGKMAVPGPKVTMSTMHSAKGREWEHVIIFGDDNVSMPNFSYINKMISDGVSIHDINSYIDEDRRLHYVATTRAKSDLAIITSYDMSVYLLEALGLFKDEKNGTNSHIMVMAQEGYIYTDLFKIIQGKVFGVSNRYYDKPDEEEFND